MLQDRVAKAVRRRVLGNEMETNSRDQRQSVRLGATQETPPWMPALVLAGSLATLAVMPLIVLGNVSGHDVEFHLPTWIDAAQHWREGVAYPSWSGGGHFGFGDPRFIIYPPLSWLLGGLLALVLPGVMLPGVYVWICVALSVFVAYGLAREWLGRGAALWAAGLYATNPYMLLVFTHRCAYSELLAQAGFPVALLFLLRLAHPDSHNLRDIAGLAAAFAWIWLSNVPLAVIASYALGFALLVLAIRGRSLRALVRGGVALGLGLGLAAFYVVPVVVEQHWIQSEEAFAAGLEHFQSRYIVNSAMAEPGSSVVRGDARESLRNCLFQRLGGSGLQRT